MKRLIICLIAVMALSAVLAGALHAEDNKVTLVYVEWDCAASSTNLVAAVLQEKMGYEVEMLPVANAAMWQSLATGDADGMVTAWLPGTHADLLAGVEDDVENLGQIVGGARIGWAVPAYVTINSIEEVNAHAAEFNNQIIGIDPGAGLMKLSEQVLVDYELADMTLVEGSDVMMTTALGDAIDNEQWIIVTAWSPHWKFAKWELKYLEDPKGVLGEEEYIGTIVRKGLNEDMPDVYTLLDNFHYEDASQLGMLMGWNAEEGADRYENALRFMEENPELVESWLEGIEM
ncbi:MAG: glycine betaine ABC transporter substrate-binding protein [Desulfovibrio sp.]|nr:MAG: glycine betaine ABC transporter substrate-binding protein [Desulfovibrio sp.]